MGNPPSKARYLGKKAEQLNTSLSISLFDVAFSHPIIHKSL